MKRLVPFAAAVSALALLVGGCSGAADKAGDKAAEKAIEKAAEDSGEDVDVDVNGDEVKIETSDGTIEAGTGNLPEGYPQDDVPLVDGEVQMGIATGEGFSVTIAYDGDPAAAFDDAVSRLTDAGLAVEADSAVLGENSAALTGNGYSVLVSASDVTGSTSVTYIVATK